MQAALEPRVRCLVADTLGVGIDELAPDVSLTDELAADSLDLAELAARLEAELRLAGPVPVWARLVSSHGELRRAELLTSDVAETIAGDALRAGRGAQIEITV